MTVEFRPTISLGKPATFDPLLSGLQTGDSLAVRVLTMVDKGVARLSILGQTMDVDTPLPLLDGAELIVTIAKDGNNLKLLVQSDLVAGSSSATAVTLGQLNVALGFWAASAKSTINQAWLTGLSRGDVNRQIHRGQPDGAAEFQIQEHIRLRFDMEGGAEEGLETPHLLAKASSDRFSLSEGRPDTDGTQYSEPFAPPVVKAHDALLVSVRLPDLVPPLLVRVMPEDAHDRADDDPNRNDVNDPQPRTWSVEFNIDAGAFGPLAITVKLNADNVSVKLRTDQGRSASPLLSVLPELRHALEMADLTVEALNVEQGKS